MRTTLLSFGLLLAGLSSAFAQQADIAGRYRLEGRNPTGSGGYGGEVVVLRTGDAYQVQWRLNNGSQRGTGLVLDKVFSVSFGAANAPGIASYRINPDGSLTGLWANGGGQQVGTETWFPLDKS